MKNSVETQTVITIPSFGDLKNPLNFKVGELGLLMKKDSRGESGMLLKYTILKYKKLPAEGDVAYRGTAVLQVQIGSDPTAKKHRYECNVSSLLCYKIEQAKEKYIGVEFVSYSTTPDYASNPLRLVKCKDGKFMLGNVTEGGVEHYTVTIPGGERISKQRFVTLNRENYYRYYEAKQNA